MWPHLQDEPIPEDDGGLGGGKPSLARKMVLLASASVIGLGVIAGPVSFDLDDGIAAKYAVADDDDDDEGDDEGGQSSSDEGSQSVDSASSDSDDDHDDSDEDADSGSTTDTVGASDAGSDDDDDDDSGSDDAGSDDADSDEVSSDEVSSDEVSSDEPADLPIEVQALDAVETGSDAATVDDGAETAETVEGSDPGDSEGEQLSNEELAATIASEWSDGSAESTDTAAEVSD